MSRLFVYCVISLFPKEPIFRICDSFENESWHVNGTWLLVSIISFFHCLIRGFTAHSTKLKSCQNCSHTERDCRNKGGNLSRDMIKPTKWVCAQRRLRSAWADAQADLSLRWAHSHFVGFVMSWLTCPCHSEADVQRCQNGRMPRLIWVFAGRTAILLVLSCRGSHVLAMLRLMSKDVGHPNAEGFPELHSIQGLSFCNVLAHKKFWPTHDPWPRDSDPWSVTLDPSSLTIDLTHDLWPITP